MYLPLTPARIASPPVGTPPRSAIPSSPGGLPDSRIGVADDDTESLLPGAATATNAPSEANAVNFDSGAGTTLTATLNTGPRSEISYGFAASAYGRAEPPEQVAQFVARLARNGDGEHRLTLRLDPGELGRIEVVIDRSQGLGASVTLIVERPETLLRLVRDQDQLARALDQAGLASEDRNIRFQLASDDAPSASRADAPRPDPRQSQNQDAPAFSLSPRQDGSTQARTQDQGGQGHANQQGNRQTGAPRSSSLEAETQPSIVELAMRTVRPRGVDITA